MYGEDYNFINSEFMSYFCIEFNYKNLLNLKYEFHFILETGYNVGVSEEKQ